MAESILQSDPSLVWTFVILGGDDQLTITLPNNPPLNHRGGKTVWKLMGTERLAAAAEELIQSAGATVTRYAEVQTEEQAEERKEVLGIMTSDSSVSSTTGSTK